MEDMISTLSDPLLVTIISFLSFKEAARTSVLSTRWRRLWRFTANIEFDEQFFVRADVETQEAQRLEFVGFIRRWLHEYTEPVLRRFKLRFSKPYEFDAVVLECILFAVSRKPRVLELDFSDPAWDENDAENHLPVFELPAQFYKGETLTMLESLTLFSCRFDHTWLINLRLLKCVSLGWIQLRNCTIKSLLANCRSLESLTLKKCWNIEYFSVFERDLQLSTLVLDNCSFEKNWFGIEAPKLRIFKYSGELGIFELQTNRRMEEADVDFGFETEFDHMGDLLQKLLQSLDSVRVLKVCSYMLQVVPTGEEPLRMESPLNVRHLILKTAMHRHEFWGIAFLLKSCPLLETLTLQMSPSRIFPDYEPPYPINPSRFWLSEDRVYKCIKQTMKIVEVKGFKGLANELYVLKHLLFFGRAMRELRLYLSDEADYFNGGNPSIYKQRAIMVRGYPRASRNLHVMIISKNIDE